MPMDSLALRELVVNAIDERKGQDVVVLDVRKLTDVADWFVVASGRSGRQALAEHVVDRARAAGVRPMGVEGLDKGEWVLVDLCDVLVHVMQPETREYYQLEKLWTGMPGQGENGERRASLAT